MTYTALPAVHPDQWPKYMRHGDVGVGPAAWQATLEALGYDLTDVVGEFGDATHNATLAFQRLRELGVDGVVGNETKANLTVEPFLREGLRSAAPKLGTIAFLQAQNYTKANRADEDIKWSVLHSMEGAEASTKAESVSQWFAGKNSRFPAPRSSAHYACDSDSIVQMVRHKDVAWAAPGANRHGIHLEHAGKARQTSAQWRDAFSEPMLQLSAFLNGGICLKHKLPIRFVERDGLDRGDKGITTHNEVTRSNLSDKGSHTDPGKNFPMDWYLGLVSNAADQLAA